LLGASRIGSLFTLSVPPSPLPRKLVEPAADGLVETLGAELQPLLAESPFVFT